MFGLVFVGVSGSFCLLVWESDNKIQSSTLDSVCLLHRLAAWSGTR